MKNFYKVNEVFDNTRLDKWFRRNIGDAPQSFIEKNIRKGNIKVNNKRKKSSYKLKKNDQIILYFKNFSPNKNKKEINFYRPTKKELKSSSKIFIENNDNFVVINKPPGIAVQSGTKSKRNILDILKNSKEFFGSYPFPVHRIDKETSGILIVAKNRKYAQLFTSLFRIRKIHKTYLGIVYGQLDKSKGTFIDVLFHYEGRNKIETKAITHYKVIDTNKRFSLLMFNPETGRKHQLRKQFLLHGHPILGDTKYKFVDTDKKSTKPLMLHAYKINFSINETRYNFCADLPLVFKNFLKEKYLKIY